MPKFHVEIAFAGLLVAGLSGVAIAEDKKPVLLDQDHALVGTIWHVKTGKAVSRAALEAKVRKEKFVFLGEKHDNPRHHALQAEMVAVAASGERKPAVVFEMVTRRLQPALDAAKPGKIAALGKALEWEKRGWPAWSMYQGIAENALAVGLPMVAGNPNRDTTRTIGRGGALDAAKAKAFRWSQTYSKDQDKDLREQIFVSHCKMLPRDRLGPMLNVQRLRDAAMAEAMRRAGARSGAVLIAGAQHVRADRAVPWFMQDEPSQVRIAFVEVQPERQDPKAYRDFKPAQFDYVWFTARVDSGDQCAKFKAMMKKMKMKKPKAPAQ